MEQAEHEQSPHRQRRHHSRRKHRGRRRLRKLWRAFWVVASAACVSASVFLFLYDDQLRKPATDDGDGDPPTKFMVYAVAVAIVALLCVLAAIFGGGKRDQWE